MVKLLDACQIDVLLSSSGVSFLIPLQIELRTRFCLSELSGTLCPRSITDGFVYCWHSVCRHIQYRPYIRTKVESMQARLQADKPLTRATFHVTVIAVCLCQALSWPSSERWFFLWSTVVLVCLPTIYMFMRRLQMSYHVFNNQ